MTFVKRHPENGMVGDARHCEPLKAAWQSVFAALDCFASARNFTDPLVCEISAALKS
jgi:hypothetical protein